MGDAPLSALRRPLLDPYGPGQPITGQQDPGPDVDRDDPGYLEAAMAEPEAPAPYAERAYMAWADREARAA